MDTDKDAYMAKFSNGHAGSIYSQTNAGAAALFDGADVTHQVIIGTTRDGMSFQKAALCDATPSIASGLLAGLLRRI